MQQSALEDGYRNGSSHAFRMRCKAVLLKAQGLSSPQIGGRLEMHQTTVNNWVKRFEEEGIKGLAPSRPWAQADNRHTRRRNHPARHRERPFKHIVGQGAMGGRNREDGLRGDTQAFFKRIGARFGRIRKRPKDKPSPQLYQHKLWELQEFERLWHKGSIDLYYGDESHVCEEAYVPYGWKFSKEYVYIPSQRGARLNCFAMIDRRCLPIGSQAGKALMPTR